MALAVATESFEDLWEWLCDLHASSRSDVPLAVHSQSGDRAGWGKPRTVAIRSLPFSKSFLRRVDHTLPQSVQEAFSALKPSRDDEVHLRMARWSQYRVVAGVLREGLTDAEELRRRLRMSEWQFQVAAAGGIRALRSALSR